MHAQDINAEKRRARAVASELKEKVKEQKKCQGSGLTSHGRKRGRDRGQESDMVSSNQAELEDLQAQLKEAEGKVIKGILHDDTIDLLQVCKKCNYGSDV